MRALNRVVLLVATLLLVLPAAAQAQASITGTVKDASGAVLPVVTVDASSGGPDRDYLFTLYAGTIPAVLSWIVKTASQPAMNRVLPSGPPNASFVAQICFLGSPP
jgi:hypothetical protein